MEQQIRQPAVAGMFYPDNPAELQQMIDGYLAEVDKQTSDNTIPKAIIVPHAGYIYSGPVAASAYARLRAAHALIKRVILLGPSHRVAFHGLATSSASHFLTPLGSIPLDRDSIEHIERLPQVMQADQAHALEHSLEVHLPFLQTILDEFTLVPLVVGDANAEEVAEVITSLWGDEHTLIVISSDLSHYHDYDTARQLDSATSNAIENLSPESILYEDACGRNPVNGLLTVARQKGLTAETIDLRNSGDTAGPSDRVVGYGAYLIH